MITLEGFEPASVSPHKQDPAWKHCQLLIKTQQDGVRVQLKKCVYCGKVFQGGGINRLKSHLAGRKGNGPTCDLTPPDVRLSMLQSLDEGIAAFRGKRNQIVVNPNLNFSKLENSYVENAECNLGVVRGEDGGMSGSGIRLTGNLTNVPLEVDKSYKNSALQRSNFLANREEKVGMSGNRTVRRMRGAFSAANGSGSVIGGLKSRDASAPIPISVVNGFVEDFLGRPPGFPNSNLFENEEVGISNAKMSPMKRARDENATGSNCGVGKANNEDIRMAIGRFLYEIQAPLDAVKNSVYFQPMVDAIAFGGMGTKAPSFHDLRGSILKKAVEEVKSDIHQHMETWARTGCSLLVNQLNCEKGRTLLNFSVYSPEGIVFLKSVDASFFIFSPDVLFEFLKEVVEELGGGHVLQVITNTEEQFALAGKRLMDVFPTLYCSPCAAACIDSMLSNFGKVEWINSVIQQARSVTRFIYERVVILNMMRRFTCGNDIVRLGVTRSATNFTTLKQMAELKLNLQTMVASEEWMGCQESKTPEGLAVLDILSNQAFWSSCILITRLTKPLLRVFKIVGSQKRAAMGFVLAGIFKAKETIKQELVKKEEYGVYWNIIDNDWKRLWRLPLHAAGFYLNPKFFYSFKGDMHNEIVSRMFDCIERLVPDINIQDEIMKEINVYKNGGGDFGRNLAVRARDNLLPAEWWSTYGGGCPNLARLAIRVLSQTCSLVQCKENQIPFEQLHKTRNRLEHQRLSDLVFVQYNLQLSHMVRKDKGQEDGDPISSDSASIVEDWVTETGMHLEDKGNPDWMSLDLSSGNSKPFEPSRDEAEDLGSGFDDNEIFTVLKAVKEEC